MEPELDFGQTNRYIWNPRKEKTRQHILHPEGGTFCKLQNQTNGLQRLTRSSPKPHPSRLFCSNCLSVMDGFGNFVVDDLDRAWREKMQ